MRLRILLLGAVFALTSCATPYTPSPFDRETSGVRSIALVDDSFPEEAYISQPASAGASFGLIGALIDTGVAANRKSRLNRMLSEQDFDAESFFEETLVGHLTAEDRYDVSVLPVTRGDGLTYADTPTDADAYLEIAVSQYGYLSAGAGKPWRPSVSATVKLLSSDAYEVLMENVILYNPILPREGVVTLTPNPTYNFKNIKEVEENPEKAVAGLKDGIIRLAETVSTLLR